MPIGEHTINSKNPSGKEDQGEEGLVAIVFNCRILNTTVTFNMAHQSGMYFDFRVLDMFYINYASILG